MKRLLLILGLLPCANPCRAAITLIQHTNKDAGSAGSTTLAYGSNPIINHLLVVVVRSGNSSGSVTTTDTIGNTWANGTLQNLAGLGQSQLSYAVNKSTAADTVTVTLGGGSATIRMAIFEYSGTATSNPLDIQANIATGTSTAPASSSFTPGANNELVLAFGAVNGAQTWTAGTNYTLEEQVPSGLGIGKLGVEDWIQTTATSTTGNFTLGASDTWIAGYAVFKSSGGAACTPTLTLLGVGRCGCVPDLRDFRGSCRGLHFLLRYRLPGIF